MLNPLGWKLVVLTTVLLLLLAILTSFLNKFKTRKGMFYPLYLTLGIFAAGFSLRISGNPGLVDIGFFLTDASYLFTYVLFTAALILGQKKYWRI